MKLPKPVSVLSALSLLIPGCGADGSGSQEKGRIEGLTTPGLRPLPKCLGVSCWQGSQVELLVADTLAECATDSRLEFAEGDDESSALWDEYAYQLRAKMRQAQCQLPGYEGTLSSWVQQRGNPNCNHDPGDVGIPAKISLSPLSPSLLATYTSSTSFQSSCDPDGPPTTLSVLGQQHVHLAAVNACMATRLRTAMPGVASAASLTLSEAEQRELLQVIRERSQLALQQYARLQLFFQTQDGSAQFCGSVAQYGDAQDPLALGLWATSHTGDLLPALGRDFASMVSLHTEVTADVLELAARSASSRAARGASPNSLAEDYWGTGSWAQRAQGVVFGGDPLSVADTGAWKQTVPTYESWPTRLLSPYVSSRSVDPRVERLRQVLSSCDTRLVQGAALFGSDPNQGWLECTFIDRAKSAELLYRDAEVCLRNRQCSSVDGNGHCAPTTISGIPATTDPSAYQLYQRYRITPEHAQGLANLLADGLEPVCPHGSDPDRVSGNYVVHGNISDAYGVPVTFDSGPTTVATIQWSRGTGFSSKPLQETAGVYSALRPFHLPPAPQILVDHLAQEFFRTPFEARLMMENARLGGASALLGTVRLALLDSYGLSAAAPGGSDPVRNAYVSPTLRKRMLDMIRGAAGGTQFTIRPSYLDPSELISPGSMVRGPWIADIVLSEGDLWPDQGFELYAVQASAWAGSLALSQGSTAFGAGIGHFLDQDPTTLHATFVPSAFVNVDGVRRWRFEFPTSIADGQRWTFVARSAGGVVRLMAGNVQMPHPRGSERVNGQSLAFGGTSSARVAQVTTPDPLDPSLPAVDAFGMARRWFPPTEPALGGGEQAASFYVQKAQLAADEATAAVEKAFQNILQETADEAAQVSATLKSQQVQKEEKASLCGDGNDACDATTVDYKLVVPAGPGCDVVVDTLIANCGTGQCAGYTPQQAGEKVLDCALDETLKAARITVPLHKDVFDTRNAPSLPAFDKFSGGALQSLLQRQWTALRTSNLKVEALMQSTAAAKAQMASLQSVLVGLESGSAKACAMVPGDGLLSGARKVGGEGFDALGVNGRDVAALGASGALLDGGPDEEHKAEMEMRCMQLKNQLDTAKFQTLQAILQVGLQARERQIDMFQQLMGLRGTSAELAQTVQRTRLATARAQLENDLFSSGLQTKFGVYRRFHQYDLWRARALMENARRQAAIARKAIEARYLLNLTDLSKDEALVSKPKLWADEVYGYDLSLPGAVGLSVGTPQPDGLYPNKLHDYVVNLDKFIQGYPISRPTVSAHADADLLTIPGPFPKKVAANLDPEAYSWSVFCGGSWRVLAIPSPTATQFPANAVATACGADPATLARVRFRVDAWGRVNDVLAHEPFLHRYNARWGRWAVNLVGTGILDCTKAQDPAACYSQSYVRFGLTHLGPSWTPNYDGQWIGLDSARARIDGGKALAAEEWLDPVANGFAKPFVAAVARTELTERPTDGEYAIEFDVAPETRLDRIERVQVLYETNYWTKQN